jgi:competence protein ComEC
MERKKIIALFLAITLLITLGITFAGTKTSGTVTVIDVGQADSIFVQAGGKNILIDAANQEDSGKIIEFLKAHKITKLDAFIGTHPHEDHIGGAADVLNSIGSAKIYMPKVASNTKTFENLLLTIKKLGMKVSVPKMGDYIVNENDVKLQVLAPASSVYDETNEYSIVTKLTVGQKTFLFTGDAEADSEDEMMNGQISLKADVLKVGHHGGQTSTSAEFLKAVAPEYAVISVGAGNTYKHPNRETLARIAKIKTYRTDLLGTVTFTTDGNTITVKSERTGSVAGVAVKKVASANESVAIYITKSGKKYHLEGCSGLKKSKILITLKEAKERGYGPCGLCHPPE